MSPAPDPATAPKRTDLPFLRHRARPAPPAPIDYTRHTAKPPTQPSPPPAPPPSPPTASSSLDLSGTSGGVDYHHRESRPTSTSGTSSSLDLSDTSPPARAPAPAPSTPSSSLDLDDRGPAPTPTRAAARPPPARTGLPVRSDHRITAHEQVLLDVRNPTVTLTRAQSGVGALTAEAVCSADVGDLRLGALYQLRSGGSSTVQLAGGHRYGPPSTRRPVLIGGREEYERIALDLRQVRDVERIALYAFSESRAELTWGGTLVLETFGGGRIELPLEKLYAGRVAVLASIYNLDGELVVRAEMETIAGDVREAARAYGYDRITWRDDRTPVD